MEQTININIPRSWISDVPEKQSILQHVFRLGIQQCGTYSSVCIFRKTRSWRVRFYFSEISVRQDIWISPTLCRRLLEQLDVT